MRMRTIYQRIVRMKMVSLCGSCITHVPFDSAMRICIGMDLRKEWIFDLMARIQLVGLKMFLSVIVSSYTQDVFDHILLVHRPQLKVQNSFLLHSP